MRLAMTLKLRKVSYLEEYFTAIFLTVSAPRNVDRLPSVFSSTAFEKVDSLCFVRHNQ